MKRLLIVSTITLVGVLALGVTSWSFQAYPLKGPLEAREGRGMASRALALLDSDRAKTELGLTDDQVQKLRQIILDTEKSSIRTRADLAIRRIELRELLRPASPDRNAVMNKVQEIAKLRGELMEQYVGALLGAKSVLTPEQQKKVQTFFERQRRGAAMRRRRRMPPQMPGPPPSMSNPPAPSAGPRGR